MNKSTSKLRFSSDEDDLKKETDFYLNQLGEDDFNLTSSESEDDSGIGNSNDNEEEE